MPLQVFYLDSRFEILPQGDIKDRYKENYYD